MVGGPMTSRYRRDLNFLSFIYYKPLGKIYSEILVRAIVVFATGPYHASRYPSKQIRSLSLKEVHKQ
jgi:hypothetical protein